MTKKKETPQEPEVQEPEVQEPEKRNVRLIVRHQSRLGRLIERTLGKLDVPLAQRDGSEGLPFHTISDALNFARSQVPEVHSELIIAPGVYNENVVIDSNVGVTISGREKHVRSWRLGSWLLNLTRVTRLRSKRGRGSAISITGSGMTSLNNCVIYGDTQFFK